jgi:hypothetical protein
MHLLRLNGASTMRKSGMRLRSKYDSHMVVASLDIGRFQMMRSPADACQAQTVRWTQCDVTAQLAGEHCMPRPCSQQSLPAVRLPNPNRAAVIIAQRMMSGLLAHTTAQLTVLQAQCGGPAATLLHKTS